jgi:lipopolysaccharide/colanic/teichoic acid biosynthesis glycosyltransferase
MTVVSNPYIEGELRLAFAPAAVTHDSRYFICKRCFDLVAAGILCVVLLPVLLCIALAIKLDTPGAVLFTQKRVGARRRKVDGQWVWEIVTFTMYKFRSMVANADQSIHEAHARAFVAGHVQESATAETVKIQGDSRITRVGQILRTTSLDELPQLLNVLKGEMSLVGPRPVPIYEADAYEPWHRERLAALPGITGLWQVEGRGMVNFDDMVQLDIRYVRSQSLWLDCELLALTLPAVISGRGAK